MIDRQQFNQLREAGLSVDQIVRFDQRQEPVKQKKDGFFKSGIKKEAEFAKGTLKGGLSTVRGAASLGERGLRGTLKTLLPKKLESKFGVAGELEKTSAEKLIPERVVTPQTPAEKAGFLTEQIAEFFVPGGASAKAGLATRGLGKVSKLRKVGGQLVRSGTEAGLIGGQTAIQQGEFNEEAKIASILGGLFPLGGKALSKVKQGLRKGGEKIQTTVIRPSARDIADGFKIATINKNNLGGTLEQTALKTHVKLNGLGKKLNDSIKAKNVLVNVQKVYQETVKKIEREKAKLFGDVGANRRVLDTLKKELNEFMDSKGNVNLVEAVNIKRGAGTKGSWSFGRPEPDANAVENVYTKFYQQMRKTTEKVGPKELRSISKEISELIPVSNAVIRRLPVSQRNNVIGLTDSIGLFASIFDPRSLALIGASKLSKSGIFGKFLANLKSEASKTQIGTRIFGR